MEPVTVHVLWDCDSHDWSFHTISGCTLSQCVYDVILVPRDTVIRWTEVVSAYGDVMSEIDEIYDSGRKLS